MKRWGRGLFATGLGLILGVSANTWAGESTVQTLTLEECLDIAAANNHGRSVSRADRAAAMALLKQARSANWPTLSGEILATRMDEPQVFTFPSSAIGIPAISLPVPGQTFNVPGMSATLPANSFGPGAPPVDVPIGVPPSQIAVPGQNFSVPPQDIIVPEQEIKLMDRDNLESSLNLTYPLYTGGKKKAAIQRAKAGVEAADQMGRRTDLDLIRDVTSAYYGAVLGKRLVTVASDTLARMEATLNLTERMYQEGSGTVKKTDYLRNKAMVETIRGAVARAENKRDLAFAGLVNLMALDWSQTIDVADATLPYSPTNHDVDVVVDQAFDANPDLARIQAGIEAAQGEVLDAKSGHKPIVALFAKGTHIENDYDAGMMDAKNKDSWVLGVAVDIPIFEGFKVKGEVEEAEAKLEALEAQYRQAADGIAYKLVEAFGDVYQAQKTQASTGEALKSAAENRDLNVRAYQQELVETEDVIEAQLMEAFQEAQYEKVLFDHIEAEARLNAIIGANGL